MGEATDVKYLLFLFAAVFVLNVIPAFAPPTWLAMSWIGFQRPEANPFLIALVAACAATCARLVLARSAGRLVRSRWLHEADRENIDTLKSRLSRHRAATAGAILLYAFSPLPSNYLFIAYGLMRANLWLIGVPFFVGRVASYAAWASLAQWVHGFIDPESEFEGTFFSLYFIASQLATIGLVVLFVRLDWNLLLHERRLRLRPSRWRREDVEERASKDRPSARKKAP
jgi:membrane protein YqaA with SNARE-associated domain